VYLSILIRSVSEQLEVADNSHLFLIINLSPIALQPQCNVVSRNLGVGEKWKTK